MPLVNRITSATKIINNQGPAKHDRSAGEDGGEVAQ
jgi:hypothetical protein